MPKSIMQLVAEPFPNIAHGASGYKKGCRCLTCRSGHREEQARYNANRRKRENQAAAPKVGAAAGNVERAVVDQIEALKVSGAEADMLVTLAQSNARNIDVIVKQGKTHLMSSAQKNLLDVMDRLKGLSKQAQAEPGDDEFDLSSLGTP